MRNESAHIYESSCLIVFIKQEYSKYLPYVDFKVISLLFCEKSNIYKIKMEMLYYRRFPTKHILKQFLLKQAKTESREKAKTITPSISNNASN
jgi:hypothetical protein